MFQTAQRSLKLFTVFFFLTVPGFCDVDQPPFNSSRYLENYSYLKDSSRRTGYFDSLKYVPLNEAGDSYLSFGGETRQHFESIRNENWGATPRDNNGWYLQRYLLHADFHWGPRFRLFTQLQAGTESGRKGGPRGVDEDRMGFNQLFVDYTLTPRSGDGWMLRLGRQEIIFGSRRFFNYRERPNLRLSHDGAQLVWERKSVKVTGFAARPVRINRQFFDNSSANAQSFWGIYSVIALPVRVPSHMDLYYIGLNRENARFDQGVAHEVRQSLGTRLWGKIGSWDYNFELLYQFGSYGQGQILAWALASDTGYTIHLGPGTKMRFSLRADLYSGDDDPNDADLTSFNPFFPKGKHISQLAASGLINQRDLQPKVVLQFNRNWSATLSTLLIWRDSLSDGIYSIGNGLLRTGQLSRARYVGTQPEVEIKYTCNRHLDIKGIFIFFDAGNFIKQTPPGKDITYVGTMLTFRF
jgi:hypothetical protein